MSCQSGLSGRASILPSPIVLPGVVSERTIRPSIHSTFANSVVWYCVSGLSERTYILPSPRVSSGVVCCLVLCQSGLSCRAYILPSLRVSSGVVSVWTIRTSIHSTFAKSVVCCCVRVDYQNEHTFYLRQ